MNVFSFILLAFPVYLATLKNPPNRLVTYIDFAAKAKT